MATAPKPQRTPKQAAADPSGKNTPVAPDGTPYVLVTIPGHKPVRFVWGLVSIADRRTVLAETGQSVDVLLSAPDHMLSNFAAWWLGRRLGAEPELTLDQAEKEWDKAVQKPSDLSADFGYETAQKAADDPES